MSKPETLNKPLQGQLQFPGEIRRYILGGNSTFTLVSKKSGQRFTYKTKSATKNRNANWSTGNQDKSTYFVSVLAGPDNDNDFNYIGLMKHDSITGEYLFTETKASKARKGSPSYDAFAYVWNSIERGAHFPTGVEFWHEGSCCICGRKLTIPESVADGIGPECKGKVGL